MKMSRSAQQSAAFARKLERQQAHIARMAAHAERRAAWELYSAAHAAWLAANQVGPKPVDPRNLPVSA